MTSTASGSSSLAAVLNPVKPSMATTSIRSRHAGSCWLSHSLKAFLERPSTMSNNLAGPLPARSGVRSMSQGDELVAPARVPPHVLVHPDRGHTLEAMLIVDEDPASLLQDGGVGAVPGHAQTLSDPGDGEVLDDDARHGPNAVRPGTVSSAAGPPQWCPASTHAHTPNSGSDALAPPVSPVSSPRARGRGDGPRCRGGSLRTHTRDTTGHRPPPGRPPRSDPGGLSGPPPRGRGHPGGRPWSDRGQQR